MEYHSWTDAPSDPRDLVGQADILRRVLGNAEEQEISGWVVRTAFDFVPTAGQPVTYEHHFGLWKADVEPKPALHSLPLQ